MATSTESIPGILEAQRRRDLGFFEEAARKYSEEVKKRPNDLPLHLEYAGLKLEQGLLGDCLDTLAAFESHVDDNMEQLSPRLVELLHMHLSFCRAATKVKFAAPMNQARQTFDAFIRDVTEEDYDHVLIAIASVYHRLLDLGRQCGYETDPPMPSLSLGFQASLARYLLEIRDFKGALKIAQLEESTETAAVLQGIIRSSEASEVLRASALHAYSDKIRLLGETEAWVQSLKEASSAYDNAGHAFGSMQIQLELIQKQPSMPASDDSVKVLGDIADRFGSVGNWLAAGECLNKLAELNRKMVNSRAEDQALKIEKRIHLVSERCRNPLLWIEYNISRIKWSTLQGDNTARSLDLVEKVNRRIAQYDAPRLQTAVLMILSQSHMALGDPYTAAYYLPSLFTRITRRIRFLWGQDYFLKARHLLASPPDGISELQSLRTEMSEIRLMTETAQSAERSQGIQRLLHLAKIYLIQTDSRGIHAVTQLVSCILSFAEDVCESLEETHKNTRQGDILETRSFLLWSQADSSKSPSEQEKFIAQTPELLHEGARLYHVAGQETYVASMEIQLSLNYERLWTLRGYQRDANEFKWAVSSLEKAKEIRKRIGSVRDLAVVAQKAMNLYFGLLWKHAFPPDSSLTTNHAVKEREEEAFKLTLHNASEADRLFNLIRHDMSSLQRQQAIVAKQNLRKDDVVQSIFRTAIETNHYAEQPADQWDWIQKAKARSISDILGLGINLPADLKAKLEKHAESAQMLGKETSLLNEVSGASVEKGLLVRERLDAHRRRMEEEPLLKEILDFRQGQPTTLTRLTELGPPQPERNILFVDWFVMSGEFWMALASASDAISTFRLSFKPKDAKKWKETFLGHGLDGKHHLDKHDQEPLHRLSSLVKPLVEMERSKPGDVLIFCPSEELHGLPLHAATISAKSAQSLVERNPIVYTASMTTFEQCVMRESERTRGRPLTHSYMAVLERAENRPLDEAGKCYRDDLYSEMKEIATSRHGSHNNIYLGSDLTADRFANALQSDIALFLGHCKSSPDNNMLNQRLVLEGRQGEELGLSVSDLFAMDVKVSHVALLACASGSERRQEGDEPLGLITALLCAGATSVVGTMWKTDVGTARELMGTMELCWKSHTDGGVVDLAGALQKMILELKSGRDGTRRTPYHWATLALHGSWFLSAQEMAERSA